MKATVNVKEFQEVMKVASNFVSTKMDGILSCVLLDVKKGSMEISATDGMKSCRSKIKVETDKDEKVVVQVKKMIDILSTLGEGDVSLSTGDSFLTLKQAGIDSKWKLKILDAMDFPAMIGLEKPVDISVNAQAFNKFIVRAGTSVDTSTEDLFSGVKLEVTKNKLKAMSSDRKRISYAEISCESDGKIGCVTPMSFFGSVAKIMGDADKDKVVKLKVSARAVSVSFEGKVFVCLNLEGEYPDIEKFLWTDGKAVTMGRTDLDQTLKRVSSVLSGNMPIDMDIKGTVAVFKAKDDFTADECEEKRGVEFKGDFSVRINSKFLAEGLKLFEKDKVQIGFKEGQSIIIFRDDGDKTWCYGVMPMRRE